ncbi:SDR family NAD(P)-dependent oxidoreductase [uncultured Nostoc sp.]|uniref:SDR family NAD(P)-dependent oxidoreductase n=1 Tax=uncultured Nostoc sp. TaxID=340711 RepID=UPI0035C97FA1
MKIDLSGKTAIVTGSTSGIGFAIAQGLAEAGATVVINGRNPNQTDGTVARLSGNVRGAVADLGTAEGCAALVAAEPSADIFINCLGVYKPADFFESDDALWQLHWEINVMAAVRLARAYLPGMKQAGWGRFVILGSSAAFNVPAEMIHYGVSKTADVALARGLAKRMAGTGVTVNSVLPGPTLSEGLKTMLEKSAAGSNKPFEEVATDFVKQREPSSIIRRIASVEEVANIVVYLASDQASATTGAALRVDGGAIDTLM